MANRSALRKPEGTEDLLGATEGAWLAMQAAASEIFGSWGFSAVETPAMEQIDVFARGLGATTDVVRKEMFRAITSTNLARVLEEGNESVLRANQRLALRPEGTAGFVRAAIEHNLVPQGGAPVKAWYAGAMFRGERVQRGRLRQFHQIGAEVLGAEDPTLDAELIIMLMDFYRRLGLPEDALRLRLNSMGCAECRPAYRELVRSYLLDHADELCDECVARADANPLRAFDCKNERCGRVMADAPKITDHLCENCARAYAEVKERLRAAGVAFEEDPTLVRGLDYYTRTVFEVEARVGMGAQAAIGGGGRYDGLAELMGGKTCPGIGFAVGFERILIALEALGVALALEEPPLIYVAVAGKGQGIREAVFELCLALRRAGVHTEADYQGRSLKSQFKQADRLGAHACLVIGDDELAGGAVTVRNMETHEQTRVALEGGYANAAPQLIARFGGVEPPTAR